MSTFCLPKQVTEILEKSFVKAYPAMMPLTIISIKSTKP